MKPNDQTAERIDRFLSRAEVSQISDLSLSTIWREQRERRFPPWEKLSRRRVGLRESVLKAWIMKRDYVETCNRVPSATA